MNRVIPEHTETDHYERRHHDTMIDKIEKLVVQFAKLQAWVTALAAISVLFIGFVTWVMKSSLEDMSVTVRVVAETQRDIYYMGDRQDRIRSRLSILESVVYTGRDATEKYSSGGNPSENVE